MSNYDGVNESATITAHIAGLCGGRLYDEIRSDAEVEKTSNGEIKPYIVHAFGSPVPSVRGRGVGGERTQPYILPCDFMIVAANVATMNAVTADVTNAFIGFVPPGDNSGEMKGGAGYSWGVTDADGATIRRHRTVRFEVLINLSPENG